MWRKVSERPPGCRLLITWDERSLSQVSYMHKYGGVPSNGATLPRCSACGDHFHLLFQIDLADPKLIFLKLDALDFLFIITCLNCASYEEPLYYRLENKGQDIVILREKPHTCVPEYPDPLEEYLVSYRPLRDDEYPLTEDDFFRLLEKERKHQLGGLPIWVQQEERIPCTDCGGKMEYIAMVDSELYIGGTGFREKGHIFGDRGILYTLVCRRCGIFVTKAQGF
jgi:hypothetical protein